MEFNPLVARADLRHGRRPIFQIRFFTRGVCYEEFVGIEERRRLDGMAAFWPRPPTDWFCFV